MKSLTFFLICICAWGQVPQAHYDLRQAGVTTSETILTSANISRLQKMCTWPVTGYIFAQPLFLPTAIGGKDVLLVAAMNNTVYAFDANACGSVIWQKSFGTPRSTYPNNSGEFPILYGQPIGILSTPYVDQANGFVYICAQDSTPQYKAYKLNLADGTTASSTVIAATVTGTGDPSGSDCVSGGVLSFCASLEFIQRPGLVVSNSKLYICFGTTDIDPGHGWVIALSTTDLSLVAAWCSTPSGALASVWIPGAAPAVDSSGNLYIATGNGDYDGLTSFGESIVKLSPTLTVLDWFTPTDWATLNTNDSDVGSNHATLISGTNYLIHVGKDYKARRIDTTCMGHLGGTVGGCSVQTWTVCNACLVGKTTGGYSQIYLNGVWTISTTGQDADSFGGSPAGSLYSYTFSSGTFNTTPTATNTASAWPFPGPSEIAASSNGTTNQIIFVVTGASQTFTATTQGVLRAFDTTLTELWNSGQSNANTLGLMTKYAAPTIASGRVYVATQSGYVIAYFIPTRNHVILGE